LITLDADRSLVRSDARTTRHLLVSFRAPEVPRREGRLPVNLAFVIDRSGSMYGEKIAYARRAVVTGIRSLHEGDRFSVVAYDDQVELVVPVTDATAGAREAAVEAVDRVDARSNTDLHGGWSSGCEQVSRLLSRQALGRCLLLTDGLANQGITDHDEIVRQCANWRDRSVTTTTLGVGADFDETLLRRMADAGGGNFQFIAAAAQITDFMASEVGEALATTVREAVLVVDAGEGASVESLNDYACRREGDAIRVAIGSLFSGQELASVLRITFPESAPGTTRTVSVRLEDRDDRLGGESAASTFTWATREEIDRHPPNLKVVRLAATLEAARAERDALECNRRGDYAGARQLVEACRVRIQDYADGDPVLVAIAADLQKKAPWLGGAIDSVSSKTFHSLSSMTLRGRLLRMPPPARRRVERTIVPSEWEAHGAVADVLSRVGRAHPGLLPAREVRPLAEKLAHLDERGCLLDLGQDSEGDVEPLLCAPDLCLQCRGRLESAGLAPDGIARIAEALRLLGAPSGVVH
jgi:Ca-activated chloride channel family protein